MTIDEKIEKLKRMHAFQESNGWYNLSESMFTSMLKEMALFATKLERDRIRQLLANSIAGYHGVNDIYADAQQEFYNNELLTKDTE